MERVVLMARRRTVRTLAQLREIGENIVAVAKEALRNGANIVAADAKRRVPVKTGKLRDSIKVQANASGTVYKITADAKSEKGVAYGRILEYSPKSDKEFLNPAMSAHRLEIYRNVENAVHDALNE